MKDVLKAFFAVQLAAVFLSCNQGPKADLLITNAVVFDGSGKDSVMTDVGITGDRISYLGNSAADHVSAAKVIDAKGFYLAPGFIDPHTHTEKELSSPDKQVRANLAYLYQGVTTVFNGNDGESPLPIGKKLDEWQKLGIGTNAALLAGHGSIRHAVLGNMNVQPDSSKMKLMKDILFEAMKDGAFGLSTGLFYVPGSYAKVGEVIELSRVAAVAGGIYDTHMRHQSTFLMDGIRETLIIGKEANIPVHISHIKADGPVVWGKSDEAIQLIDEARKNGIDASANLYPYLASRTSLKARVIPGWAEEGGDKAMLKRFDDPAALKRILAEVASSLKERGGADKIVISDPTNKELHNKSLQQIASAWKLSPEESAIRILKQNAGVSIHAFVMQEYDMLNFMKQPWTMIGSDGRPGGHPRAYGTFPKIIREFVLDKKILSMKEAVHRCTGLTAKTFGVKERGLIRKGFYADIVLFDPKKVQDHANYEQPDKLATGFDYVLVNGTPAISEGKYTGALNGKILRK